MNLKKSLVFILIPILAICVLIGLHWLHADQAKILISSFLDNIIKFPDIVYGDYIHPHFEGSLSLIEFLSGNRQSIGYRILSSRRVNIKEYKVSVELVYNDHNIPINFMVIRDDGKWSISHMPEYNYIPAAFLLEYRNDGKDQNVIFDIRGDTVSYSSVYPLSLKKWTPMSLHTIDEYIIDHAILKINHISKVLRYGHNTIEDIYMGNIKTATKMPVYTREVNGFTYSQDNFIPIGAEEVYICSDTDNIAQLAIYDRQTLYTDRIRVLISDSSHQSKSHKEINMLCNGNYKVKLISRDEPLEFEFEIGDQITFKPSQSGVELYHRQELLATAPNRWHIGGNNGNTMYMQDIKRGFTQNSNEGTPYRGNFEVSNGSDGLLLINEVPVEEYLYSVVTSEMPVSFGLEALKVQAVAARAYAIASIGRAGFASYGAHLDDSTASQMYNNTIEHPTALSAVQSTAGLIPFYEDEIVDTRFFSTSPGYTATSSEVWSDSNGNFPGVELPYLLARPQYTGDSPSLHNDENFRAFIDNVNNTSYDRFSPFFRWSIELSREVLEASINENLPIVQRQEPKFVLTRVGEDYCEDMPITTDIGELLNIVVLKRGHGGNIMELELSTTSGNYKIIKELNVRNVLKPINYLEDGPVELKCHDGSTRENFPLLPSAFAYIDIARDNDGHITLVTIKGGGYGHGVGMSQYGTYGLTLLGKTFKEILEHYYPGSELKQIY